MTCSGSLALPWQFAAFWCVSGYVTGIDRSGLLAQAFLTDTQVNFVNASIRPNEGMVLYNITQNTSGPVTAVTATTLTATGVTWNGGDAYRIAALNASEQSTIQMYLDITAGDIFAALAAMNNCNCTWQSWVPNFLAKINIIEAAAFYECPCGSPRMSDERQEVLLNWATTQLEKLRSGDFAICEGDTSKSYPAYGSIELAHTLWSEAEIIGHYNERLP